MRKLQPIYEAIQAQRFLPDAPRADRFPMDDVPSKEAALPNEPADDVAEDITSDPEEDQDGTPTSDSGSSDSEGDDDAVEEEALCRLRKKSALDDAQYEQRSERYEHPKYGTIHLGCMAGSCCAAAAWMPTASSLSGSEPRHRPCTQCFNKV